MYPGIYFHCLCERVREYQRRVPQEHAGVTVNTTDLSRRQEEGSSETGMMEKHIRISHSEKGRQAFQTDMIAQGETGKCERSQGIMTL